MHGLIDNGRPAFQRVRCLKCHTSVYDKRNGFWISSFTLPWLISDDPRYTPYGMYISQLIRFARRCTSVLNFHSEYLNFKFYFTMAD